MRQFIRPTVTPPVLGPLGSGGKLRQKHLDEGQPPSSLPEHWTKPDVRGALLAMQGHVCAYCSSELSQAASDVEHFRPKQAGYWWLAYTFQNYLLSCKPCNQTCKGPRFPLQTGTSGKSFPERHLLHEEQTILLDPVADPVEDWVQVSLDALPNDDFLKLTPSPGAPNPPRIRDAIRFFALNTKIESMRARMAILQRTAEAIRQGTPEAASELAIRHRPQSLVCWQLLRLSAPDALPSVERELEWLLGELCDRLREKLRLTVGPSVSNPDTKEIEELYWALATLCKSPPTDQPAAVFTYLKSPAADLPTSVLDLIAHRYARL